MGKNVEFTQSGDINIVTITEPDKTRVEIAEWRGDPDGPGTRGMTITVERRVMFGEERVDIGWSSSSSNGHDVAHAHAFARMMAMALGVASDMEFAIHRLPEAR
jgi:hypothetical protein